MYYDDSLFIDTTQKLALYIYKERLSQLRDFLSIISLIIASAPLFFP